MVDGELKKGIPGTVACVEPKQDVSYLVVASDIADPAKDFCCIEFSVVIEA
jgi:hypothetical protein